MAPPSAQENVPLQERLIKLAQTLQFGWFVGHVALLAATVRYSLSYITFNYNSRWSAFSYRVAFISAAVTYGIVVFKSYRARAKSGKGNNSPLALIGDENVQYLAMALVWLFSRQIALAMLPFTVYSTFHVATYTRGVLLPILQPPPVVPAGTKPPASAISDAIGRFVKNYYDASMSIVAALEIALWFRILGSAIIFQKGSWILLVIYTVFLRSRITQSTFVQGTFKQIEAQGDALAARNDVPPAARGVWEQIKSGAKVAHAQTDINRYVSGPQGAPKKAQ